MLSNEGVSRFLNIAVVGHVLADILQHLLLYRCFVSLYVLELPHYLLFVLAYRVHGLSSLYLLGSCHLQTPVLSI